MASLLALAVIRRLYALGTFLGSRFKSIGLLFALCRKLATCRLWYCSPAESRKPKSSRPSCTLEHPPLAGSFNSRGPTAAASFVPTPASSSEVHHASMSRAPIRFPAPDVGRSVLLNSHQSYSLSTLVSTPRVSGTVTPGLAEDASLLEQRIDMMPVGVGPPQQGLLPPTHAAPWHTNFPINETAFPMNPGNISRYMRHSTIRRDMILQVIKPLTMNFPHFLEPDVSNEDRSFGTWTSATHPEGALYFYDKERRLFTDTDMHDKALRGEAEHCYNHLQMLLEKTNLAKSSEEYDLVLEIKPDLDQPRGFKWLYYYVSHANRCLFWLEEYHTINLTQKVGVRSLAHIKHQLEYFYWSHWSLFPVNFGQRKLPKEVYDELLGMLAHSCIDVMTSKTSTLWLDDDQMQKMITLVKDAKMASAGEVYYIAGAARLLSLFANWRFLDFHGQINARLNRHKAIYHGPSHSRSMLIIVLSPLLFFAPQKYLTELEESWVDQHILEPVWKSLMTKMLGEWSDLILWSTVMLSVNVGFLAIPGVVPSTGNNNTSTPPTPNQISSYLSLIASVGSIVVGLLLARHHRTKKEEDTVGAARYLSQNDHGYFGLEPMAIVFSLPWALLMWAMMFFSVELLILCFRRTDLQLRLPVGIMSTFVAAPIAWCMWNSWKAKFDAEM